MSFSNNAIFQDYESSDTNSAYQAIRFQSPRFGSLFSEDFPTNSGKTRTQQSSEKLLSMEREREAQIFLNQLHCKGIQVAGLSIKMKIHPIHK